MTTHALQPFSGALPVSAGFQLQAGTKAVLLVTNVVDDSGSISAYGNTKAIQRGYNEGLDNFTTDQDQTRQLFVSTLLINKGWLYQAKAPEEADRLDDTNYNPSGGTPLFTAIEAALDFVSHAADYLTRQGLAVYSITNILTDGADTTNQPPSAIQPVVSQMQETGNHIVTGIAVRDGTTDFFRVFTEMGILEKWIKVIERQEGDIVAGVSAAVSVATGTSTMSRGEWTRTTTRGFIDSDKK